MLQPQSMAATVATPREPRDLVVSSFYWGRVETTDVDMSAPFPKSASEEGRRRNRRGFNPDVVHLVRRETYALVRNAGTHKIKAITWDFVFYEDAKHERELKRFQFRTKETIGPGEMKFLAEQVNEAAPSAYADVVVERLDYDDGTAWQRTPATK
jgi:hypothetical protein